MLTAPNENALWHKCWALQLIFALLSVFLLAGCDEEVLTQEEAKQALKDAALHSEHEDFEKAYELFARAAAVLPEGSEEWSQAMIGKGLSLWMIRPATAESVEIAQNTLRQVIEHTRNDRYKAAALYNLARIFTIEDYDGDLVNIPRARALYREVIAMEPQSMNAGRSLMRIAETYTWDIDKPDLIEESLDELLAWVQENPKSPLAVYVWEYAAQLYWIYLQNDRLAFEAYRKAEELGWGQIHSKHTRLPLLIHFAEKESTKEERIELYQKLARRYPNDHAGALAEVLHEKLVSSTDAEGVAP